ncbi:MAG: prepilin-type N-terminal cleavage/methylation domain-containing protein [Candidatus Eremiobacterota bacterium]
MRGGRGFSLVECLVTLLLVLVILGATGALLREYAGMTKTSSGSERILAVQTALFLIDRELHQAVTLNQPVAASPSALLELTKVNPAVNAFPARPGDRLPYPLVPPGPGFDPLDPADMLTVRYQDIGGSLLRQVIDPSGGVRTQVAVQGIDGFSAKLVGPQLVEVEVSLNLIARVQEYRTRSFLPVVW